MLIRIVTWHHHCSRCNKRRSYNTLGTMRSFCSNVDSVEHTSRIWRPPATIEDLFASNKSRFSAINAPTAGSRSQMTLPRGDEAFQLHSLATPNGQKVGILLEELGVSYDAHHVHIGEGAQFTSGFVEMNPNSKIPAAMHYVEGRAPVRLFESASIMLYLAELHEAFIPPRTDAHGRAEVLNWLFWQMSGQGPMTGNYGHFMVYAPDDKGAARDYGVARYGMEVQRCCSVLENRLASVNSDDSSAYLVNNTYSVADMACFPWVHQLLVGYNHVLEGSESESSAMTTTADFLSINSEQYPHLMRWHDAIEGRLAVKRGLLVCPFSNKFGTKPWMHPDWVDVRVTT